MHGTHRFKHIRNAIAVTVMSLVLGACAPGDEVSEFITTPSGSAPTISGNPPAQVNANSQYSFTPTASGAGTLTFSVSGLPGWASFSTSTGTLSGMPSANDAGSYTNIIISVTDGQASASLPAFSITVVVTSSNSGPTISGNPPAQINANSQYSFTPTASDPDGDTLTFSVSGLPDWASFNQSTGSISGTPVDADVGAYSNISITVSDGTASATLGPFSITVNAISLGSVTLSWTPPTQNEDGTVLMDLAGYNIYWGTSSGSYPNSIRLDNPGLSAYMVENLAPGTYEFVATSFNASGVESTYSNSATKVVN